jgi:hypothetical protein
MFKLIKTILILSALLLFLLSVHNGVELSYGGASGNERDAITDKPPINEAALDKDIGEAARSAALANDVGGNENSGYADAQNLAVLTGMKDGASNESMLLMLSLLALLSAYVVIRVARMRGWQFFKRKT